MGILEILVIAIGLSMDAFAVTIASSMGNMAKVNTAINANDENCVADSGSGNAASTCESNRFKVALSKLSMPLVFGVFQGIMPMIGFFAGSFFAVLVDAYAGIIALVILAIIGGKMIFEGLKSMRNQSGHEISCLEQCNFKDSRDYKIKPLELFAQGIATSIDALIVGVGFAISGADIFAASAIIAATTFICCTFALAIGRRFGVLLGDKTQVFGGILLVLIGIKSCFF
ncbi:MAG: manganese efflux pump MntP family protein [Coriobacteriales bacterium]|jgi:putative Mn2+ efflux pump MntP|nr:manganese efflux pump MntP family protein [Coriobacteriales bacterium]